MQPITTTDILVLGAGMVGASLVHLLRPALEQGLSLTLIDRQALQWDGDVAQRPPSFDGRATALSYGTQQILQQLGCWQGMSERACAIKHIQVSDQGHFGQTQLHAHEQNTDALGYVVENAVIGQGLLQGLEHPNVRIMAPCHALSAQMNSEGVRVTLADGQILQASLLVLADGARSELAQQLGIGHHRRSYGTHALVTQVEVDKAHENWAFERFTRSGPIAFLPLQQRHFAVVWTIPNEEIDQHMAYSDDELLAKLQAHIGHRVGRLLRVGQRQCYPLALVTAHEQVRRSLVLLGNAAHSLHPVAGQGFNLALRDAAALAEQLNKAWLNKQAIGDLAVLQAYERQQAVDQRNTITASDWLPRLFGSQKPLVAFFRDMGLLGMSMMPRVRRLFTRHAMGLGQRAAVIGPLLQQESNNANL